ncbi:sterol desaturase family protein [Aliikangiella marina]|uniref:Sterol desaturase family protein n=1 Tax=Aliikangiella marina TaxID=1712262 RepID=A0A545T8V0_9GAMM|nr:sterol desaturase family protein [Aliikangiella marina]TQV73615.1 sterol desaturase family protein [Aliikangiella marina]
MNPNDKAQNIEFRENYRQTQIGPYYRGLVHFGFTMTFAWSIIIYSIFQLENVQPLEYLTVLVTFLYANFVEYIVHKGPMHRPFKGLNIIYKRHATQHHIFFTDHHMQFDSIRDFKAVLFPPILIAFFFVFFALPAGVLINWLVSSNACFLFIITAFFYFALYEVLHTTYHLADDHWVYRFAVFRKLRKLHQDHHRIDLMAHNNFNITFPICDWLFGTYYREEAIDRQGEASSKT